jgi:hypothetical protein
MTAERRHNVTVDEREDGYWLTGLVMHRRDQETRGELAIRVWTRNRAANLVGFRFTKRGDLIGECFVPKAGLTKDEFELCVGKVARECDRMEYILTGADKE